MNRIPERNRPLVILAVGVAVLVIVAGGVLLVGRLGPPPAPTPSGSQATASPSANPSTPEGATRAFFDAVIAARRTDDPSLIEPFVTSTSSSAYRTVESFLAGQKESHKASITDQARPRKRQRPGDRRRRSPHRDSSRNRVRHQFGYWPAA